MNELTEKEYIGLKSLRKRMEFVFKKLKVPGDFEDFFQRYQSDLRSGYRQHQLIDHFAVDYIREKLGRNGQKTNFHHAVEFQEDLLEHQSEYTHSLPEIMNEIDRMSGKCRVIVGLSLIYGLNEPEIGFLFNVSGSRVSQLITDFSKDLYRNRVWPGEYDEVGHLSPLRRIEKAAQLLKVPVWWLRNKMEERE